MKTEKIGFCWLVIRVFRHRRRVLSMHEELTDAEAAFLIASEKLRDGDVLLVRADLEKLNACSGGYNRTRW